MLRRGRSIERPYVTKIKKTSLKLDAEMWKRAHVRAMDDGVDLQTVIGRALDAYLRTNAGPEMSRRT